MGNFRTWLWIAVVLQFLTAAVHSVGLFISLEAANETERQLIELMDSYRFDMGASFRPTMGNLFTAVSTSFSMLCIFGGLINAFLLKKRVDREVMSGVLLINVIIFGTYFAVLAVFTFLLPIVMTGLIVVCLIAAAVLQRNEKPAG